MAVISQTEFQRRRSRRKWMGRAFYGLCVLSVLIALGMLAVLLAYLFIQGITGISWSFLTSFASRHPDQAGIKAAILGSIYVVMVAGSVSFVLGVASAIYLEEYAARSKFARIAKINIAVHRLRNPGVADICSQSSLGQEHPGRWIHFGPAGAADSDRGLG